MVDAALFNAAFIAAAATAVLVAGISKGGLGGGLGTLSVPLMALVISPVQAAAIMLPILCAMDLFAVRSYWRKWDLDSVKRLIPGAAFGIAIGTLTFRYLDPDSIRLLVGLTTLGFVAQRFLTRSPTQTPTKPGSVVTGAWGTVAGFTSFVAGGAPAQMVLLPQQLHKTTFVGTMALFFAFVNYAKLGPYAWLGQLDLQNITTSLLLSPLVPLGVWLGVKLHTRTNQVLFYRVIYVALFFTGAKLTHDGVAGLI